MTDRRSVLFLSLQTYVFLRVIPADAELFCQTEEKHTGQNQDLDWSGPPAQTRSRSGPGLRPTGGLTLGPVVAPFLRSGMSALLGLLALPSRGLEGGAPGFRSWTSSLELLSPVVV